MPKKNKHSKSLVPPGVGNGLLISKGKSDNHIAAAVSCYYNDLNFCKLSAKKYSDLLDFVEKTDGIRKDNRDRNENTQ